MNISPNKYRRRTDTAICLDEIDLINYFLANRTFAKVPNNKIIREYDNKTVIAKGFDAVSIISYGKEQGALYTTKFLNEETIESPKGMNFPAERLNLF